MSQSIRWFLQALSILVLIASPAPPEARAQSNGAAIPRVFFDCQGQRCDDDYFRTEITWIAWVRDQADANVHVIMTSQNTGVGGREFVLDFLGRPPYAEYVAQSRYQSLPTDTEREDLDGIALTLALGVGQFATQNGFRNVVSVEGIADAADAEAAQGIVAADEVQDPWNLWVFRVNANGNLNKQSSRENTRIGGGFNASRVTPTWKQSYNGNFNYREQEIQLGDGDVFTDERYDFGVFARAVYALAEHWSIGFTSNIGRNTTNNQDIWGQFNPAVEYSVFPYEEATRRSLTAFYEIGPVYRHYFEETVLGEASELRAEQALSLEFAQTQPWGNASVTLRGSHYLHDFELNNVSLRGFMSFRVTRGLDLNFGGSYSRVRDQIFLSGEGLTDEERLLELRQEQTDYEASVNFGFSYQFGSIFNNVVNNRFPFN